MSIKVAIAQMSPGENHACNLRNTLGMIRSAAAQGARLIVLPEMCTSPYMLGDDDLSRWSEEIPSGQSVHAWLQASRELEIAIVAGILEYRDGHFFNSAICLDKSGLLSHYRKMHLFGWEQQCLAAGKAFRHTADVDGTRIGMLICYDLRFVEVVRSLALDGVQLLCLPKTWTDVGKSQPLDQYGLPGAAHLALGQAYANKIFLLCAGRVGTEKGVSYLGRSLIATPDGHIVAGPGSSDEEVLFVAEIEPTLANHKQIGRANHVFKDRRTDLY
tara:strand:- start:11119 stop:11937 length:819 start_codon:yes stop_codon:yes gene_type:complete